MLSMKPVLVARKRKDDLEEHAKVKRKCFR